MTSTPTPAPSWESLRFRGEYAGHALTGHEMEAAVPPPVQQGWVPHVWRVFRLVATRDGRIVRETEPVGSAAMVWTGLGWEGPFLLRWPRSAPGWEEVARNVVEAALDASGWTSPTVSRTVRDDERAPDGTPWAAALERLGMHEVRRDEAGSCWVLAEASVFRRPAVDLGVAFSGGGLRATGFALGAWSLLQDVGLEERVEALSSTSGGSILVGAWLASQARSEDRDTFRRTVLRFLRGERLASPSRSTSDSLIRRYADHAARELFSAGGRPLRLGDLRPGKDVVFQITEMTRAGGFRLGVRRDADGRTGPRWGTEGLVLPADVVAGVRLADAVAASAAFPVGFEPFVFPRDFDLSPETVARVREKLREAWRNHRWPPLDGPEPTDVPLVDGGVYDNQGIQGILRAARRKNSRIDLILVVDADGTDRMRPLLPVRALKASTAAVLGVGAVIGTLGAGGLAALLLPYGLYRVQGMLPPGLGLLDFLSPRRFVAGAATRAEVALALLTDAFMRRVRRLVYEDLYAEGLPRSVAVATAQIRDLVAHHHARGDVLHTREALLSARYPASLRVREAATRAAAVSTTLRLSRRASERRDLARDLVVTGRATTLLSLVRTVHFVPRPRHPDARAWLTELEGLWEREIRAGRAPDWLTSAPSQPPRERPEAA